MKNFITLVKRCVVMQAQVQEVVSRELPGVVAALSDVVMDAANLVGRVKKELAADQEFQLAAMRLNLAQQEPPGFATHAAKLEAAWGQLKVELGVYEPAPDTGKGDSEEGSMGIN